MKTLLLILTLISINTSFACDSTFKGRYSCASYEPDGTLQDSTIAMIDATGEKLILQFRWAIKQAELGLLIGKTSNFQKETDSYYTEGSATISCADSVLKYEDRVFFENFFAPREEIRKTETNLTFTTQDNGEKLQIEVDFTKTYLDLNLQVLDPPENTKRIYKCTK
jgi:hypothetical protein